MRRPDGRGRSFSTREINYSLSGGAGLRAPGRAGERSSTFTCTCMMAVAGLDARTMAVSKSVLRHHELLALDDVGCVPPVSREMDWTPVEGQSRARAVFHFAPPHPQRSENAAAPRRALYRLQRVSEGIAVHA